MAAVGAYSGAQFFSIRPIVVFMFRSIGVPSCGSIRCSCMLLLIYYETTPQTRRRLVLPNGLGSAQGIEWNAVEQHVRAAMHPNHTRIFRTQLTITRSCYNPIPLQGVGQGLKGGSRAIASLRNGQNNSSGVLLAAELLVQLATNDEGYHADVLDWAGDDGCQ